MFDLSNFSSYFYHTVRFTKNLSFQRICIYIYIYVKNGLDNFDVPMGGYDSSQIADLVGLYILDMLTRIIIPQQVGLLSWWWVIIYPK